MGIICMSNPYETRRPLPYWAAIQQEILDNLGFDETWFLLEDTIQKHKRVRTLLTQNPKLFAREIDEKDRIIALLEAKRGQ